MKKIIYIQFVAFICAFKCFCQNQGTNGTYYVLDPNHAGKIFHNPTSETNRILGTPYTQTKFAYAEIENIPDKHFMRYNAYSDNFEFITFKNDTLEMEKMDNINNITFTKPYKKYSYLNYISNTKGRKKGYLVEMYTKGDFLLYKKEAVTFYAGKKAKNTLETDISANYSKVSYSYFFKTKTGNIIPFPENKKQLIKLYPDKKQEIETFIKENKVSFSEDYDRIKIIDFLSAL